MIPGADKVTSIFGYWPEFADARLLSFSFNAEGTATLTLSYIDAAADKAAVVTLQFSGTKDVQLTELASDNVLDCLVISEGNPMAVTLEPCIGLGGTFSCTGASVTGVAPNRSFKPKTLRVST